MNTPPRLNFAQLPTAVEDMSRLTAHLNGPRLIVKRDDLTGLALGGNKTRKLEFLLAEAKARGAQTLITAGAAQSNHCRQTAAAAARYGFECTIVLTLPKQSSIELDNPQLISGNLLLDHLFGAKIVWCEREERDQMLQDVFHSAELLGKNPYLIPYGGSSPVGISGYVFAVEELIMQNISPDWIVFPTSSGGTQAGLILGSKIYQYRGKILGISVDEDEDILKQRVDQMILQTASFLGVNISLSEDDILVNSGYIGEGYAVMGEAEQNAVNLFAQFEGLLVDPVYTGRAAAGLLDLIKAGFFDKKDTVLFWHTGGTPALFADRYRSIVRTSN